MSYANFKPTIWSKFIQSELEKECTLADWCNKKFEGEAKKGEQVKIIGAGNPTIKKYTPGVAIDSPEATPDSAMYLKIDQYDYFNITIDDIDKAQSNVDVMKELIKNGNRGFSYERDKYVGKIAQNASYITEAATKIDTAAKAKSIIDKAILQLRKNDVKTGTEVAIELPWFMYQLFKTNLIELKTANDELLKRGIVGMYDGCYIRPSNLLYTDDASAVYCMARTHDAIAFAGGIDETEAYRPQNAFSDALKALSCYGAKIVRPKELYVFKVTE